MPPLKWFGPRNSVSNGVLFPLGGCKCCGCDCQSAVGDVNSDTLEELKLYPIFTNGARLKIVIDGLPSSYSFSLARPPSGFDDQNVYDVTVTGMNAMNGTMLASIPLSQYKCLWGGEAFSNSGLFFEEFFPLSVTSVNKYIYRGFDPCSSAIITTTTTNITINATIRARVVRKNHADPANVESTTFRYVSVLIGFSACAGGSAFNFYWPEVEINQYRLDDPIAGSASQSGTTGVGLDCKRLADIVSGVFTWKEQSCPGGTPNDETTTAICGTGGGDVADVTGAVGSYSIQVERL
jgi:hypothetical protein